MRSYLVLTALLCLCLSGHAAVVRVPQDAATIQAGIDAAAIGDTVLLAPGIYRENPRVNKRISIIGSGQNRTVIKLYMAYPEVVYVSASGVVIKHLSVTGGLGTNPAYAGIRLFMVDSCVVDSCRLYGNGGSGLAYTGVFWLTVSHCFLDHNQYGISGVDYAGATRNNVSVFLRNNVVTNNSSIGINLAHWAGYHQSYMVRDNLVASNGIGIYLINSQIVYIEDNCIYRNTGQGVTHGWCDHGGQPIYIFGNQFVENNSGGVQASDAGGVNNWYHPLNHTGNYWSDYSGTDGNADGIGDTPYAISGGVSSDQYPLMAMTDSDFDEVPDSLDNCPAWPNTDQEDSDYDHIGDFCDECSDFDGDGYYDVAWPVIPPTCGQDVCPTVYNPDQADHDGNGVGDACDFGPVEFDDVSFGATERSGLRLGRNGSYGDMGSQYAGTHNLDFTYGGECDENAKIYLFDGTPIVTYTVGTDTVAASALYGSNPFHLVSSLEIEQPLTPVNSDYNVLSTGLFTTPDFRVAMRKVWIVPTSSGNDDFIIQKLEVYSYDGWPVGDLSVGEGIDWDIPTDNGNVGGWDQQRRLIYLQGVEVSGGCQRNDYRFGGQAYLGTLQGDSTTFDDQAMPHGAYTASNPRYLWPHNGFWKPEIYAQMRTAGHTPLDSAIDQHTVMTYLPPSTLTAIAPLRIYSLLVSMREGSLPEFLAKVDRARQWFQDHIAVGWGCCQGNTGNVDGDSGNTADISDLSTLVDYLFFGGTISSCDLENDVDGSGAVDISDLQKLIDYLFFGQGLPACP